MIIQTPTVLTGIPLIIDHIGTILGGMIEWAEDVLAIFTTSGNELLLFFVIAGAAYMGVNLLRKLMRF